MLFDNFVRFDTFNPKMISQVHPFFRDALYINLQKYLDSANNLGRKKSTLTDVIQISILIEHNVR